MSAAYKVHWSLLARGPFHINWIAPPVLFISLETYLRFVIRGGVRLIFWHVVCVGLAAHAMWLCEDPGSRQPGLGAVLSLQPARKMAAEEDSRQIKGK